jgi:hypothetical protein
MPADFFDRIPTSSVWPGGVAGQWLVPSRIELDTNESRLLIDAFGSADGQWHSQERAPHKLLDKFIALAEAPGTAVLKFARKWGVLGLCTHGLPYWHDANYLENQFFSKHNMPYFDLRSEYWPNVLFPKPAPVSFNEPKDCRFHHGFLEVMSQAVRHRLWVYEKDLPGWDGVQFVAWEPLDVWRSWSRRAGALLSAAEHLQCGRPAPKDTWLNATAIPDGMSPGSWVSPRTIEEGWQDLSHLLTAWMSLAEVRPVVRTRESRQERAELPHWQIALELPARGLFGALTLQLLLAASKKTGYLTCFECGKPYLGKRPQPGNKNYCPASACKKAGPRNRMQRMRDRRRKAQS